MDFSPGRWKMYLIKDNLMECFLSALNEGKKNSNSLKRRTSECFWKLASVVEFLKNKANSSMFSFFTPLSPPRRNLHSCPQMFP